jgi:hypothetical protein
MGVPPIMGTTIYNTKRSHALRAFNSLMSRLSVEDRYRMLDEFTERLLEVTEKQHG